MWKLAKRIIKWSAMALLLGLLVAFAYAYWTSDNTCGDPNTAAPGNQMKAVV